MPTDATNHVTTEQLIAATRTTREQLYRWSAERLIKRPWMSTSAEGRPVAMWPADTLPRVRLILTLQRQGATPEDITDAIRRQFPPQPVPRRAAGWPPRPRGRVVRTRRT